MYKERNAEFGCDSGLDYKCSWHIRCCQLSEEAMLVSSLGHFVNIYLTGLEAVVTLLHPFVVLC